MNSMINYSKLLAAALCGAALVGCNAVEDVPNGPSAELPLPRQVVQGTVTGLGTARSIVLINNGDLASAIALTAVTPVTPDVTNIGPPPAETHFTFGAKEVFLPDGSPTPYNVTVRENGAPYGRVCVVHDGQGFLRPGAVPPNIRIECAPHPLVPRHNLTVALTSAFSSSQGAKVRLTTEEGIYEVSPVPGSTSLTFTDVLINAATSSANGTVPLPPIPAPPDGTPTFIWTVSASNMEGGNLNKCPVANPTNPNVTVAGVVTPQNPSGDTVGPSVSTCTLTVGGRVVYSLPQGVTTAPTLGAGLTLEVRDLAGNFKASQVVPAGAFPINFTFNNPGTTTPFSFRADLNSVLDIVVTNQPAGQTCVVGDGGHASLTPLVSLSPLQLIQRNPFSVTAVGTTSAGTAATAGTYVAPTPTAAASSATAYVLGTRLVVFCRASPASANVLKGTYRVSKQTATMASTATPAVITTPVSEWLYLDTRTQNSAAVNFMQFFANGTFLYGSAGATLNATTFFAQAAVQLEHGFYDYNAANGTLRFTMHTDTNTSTTFPTAFGTSTVFITAPNTFTPGLSASPGAFVVSPAPASPAATRHAAMCNVQKVFSSLGAPIGITKKITGSFGVGGGASLCGTAPTASGARQLDWELTEPHSLDNEMTGAWVTRDSRRMWVFDADSTYGTHIGVNGAPTMQNACFTVENYHASDSTYNRRGAITQCLAFNRPALNPPQTNYTASGAEAADWPGTGAGQGGGSPYLQSLPGWIGRIPGGTTAFDGRSTSPARFVVANSSEFFSSLATGVPEKVASNKLFFPPTEDVNGNGVLDSGEDANFNGVLDVESLAWCTTQVLGVRGTLNGVAIDKPVYFCRNQLSGAGADY
jgi:hypothetical protein